MKRSIFSLCLTCSLTIAFTQPRQISLGIFTGLTTCYTWDTGINQDPRYQNRYDLKAAPIGICYGVDYQGYGFVINPGLMGVGQNYKIINTVGGQEGVRKINLQYLNLPVAFKLHVIDLAFFKVSLVAGASAGYLLDGKEYVTHNSAKFRFPQAVYPILPSDYSVEYDGVLAPKQDKHIMLSKSDFKPLQIFGSFGFRSDWDVTEVWRISLDVRAQYGFTDPRTSAYLARLSDNQTLYDLPGNRRDIFAYLNIGIARYIEVDKAKEHKTKSSKRYIPKKYPWVQPHRGKPKG
jgi:hypothetical protein